jgi:hypothetical protein
VSEVLRYWCCCLITSILPCRLLLDPQRNLEVEEEVGAASNLASAAPAFLPASDFRPGIHASRVFDIKVKQLETTRGLPSRLIVDQTSR